MVPPPCDTGAATQVNQDHISDEIYALCTANNLIGIDMSKRWGTDFAYARDTLHYLAFNAYAPTDAGNQDEGIAVAMLLRYCLAN